MPSPLPPERMTLVAPMLPEPWARTSPLPARRISSRPKGMLPARNAPRQADIQIVNVGQVIEAL